MKKNFPKLDWGGFALLEYLLSKKKFPKKFEVLDIGGAFGNHSEVMRSFGLSVDLIDKYEEKAEFRGDFNTFNFKKKYDMIFCSHVIEHQRNQGAFLDKIYDILKDEGDLVISGPTHEAEAFVEGHISTTILPVFLQILIYAGFDCKKGKMMSIAGVENSFIVKKAKNFSIDERTETGYRWSQKHQERSPIFLKSGIKVKLVDLITHNCEVIKTHIEYKNSEVPKLGLMFNPPKNHKKKNVNFLLNMWNRFPVFNSKSEVIYEPLANKGSKTQYMNFNI